MSHTDRRSPSPQRQRRRIWFGLLGGAGAWALHLSLSYLLVPDACRAGSVLMLHLTTIGTLLVAGAAVVSAWRALQATRQVTGASEDPVRRERDRFLAIAGLFLSGLFCVLTVFEGMPVFFIDPCIGVEIG